ncbi:hypothetical protein HN873_029987 [Arachis hypogaea]
MAKWRLKHFFEHQFPCVLRSSTAVPVEKIIDNDVHFDKDVAGADLESNCVCLARMVQNFMEDNHDNKHPVFVKCFCNRFNDNCEDNSDIKSDVAFGETNQPSSRETNTVFSYCAMNTTVASLPRSHRKVVSRRHTFTLVGTVFLASHLLIFNYVGSAWKTLATASASLVPGLPRRPRRPSHHKEYESPSHIHLCSHYVLIFSSSPTHDQQDPSCSIRRIAATIRSTTILSSS